MKKDEKMSPDPTWISLNFETDLDPLLDTKIYLRSGFSHLLFITCIVRGMHSLSALVAYVLKQKYMYPKRKKYAENKCSPYLTSQE